MGAVESLASCVAATLPLPLVLSAKSARALRAQASGLLSFLEESPALPPVDVAWTLASTRASLDHRAVVSVTDREEMIAGLAAVAEGADGGIVRSGRVRAGGNTAFVFSGQGSQRAGMGRELYADFPAFASAFDEICELADPLLGTSLRAVVFDADGDALDRTEFAQPALFAIEWAIFRLLETYGVTPDFVVGHSVGEIAAACAAEVLAVPDAVRLVVARGRLMQQLAEGGAMSAVQAAEAELTPLLSGRVSIAAVNGPEAVVISGSADEVRSIAGHFAAKGRKVKELTVAHAFHSPLMDPMLEDFEKVCAEIEFGTPRVGVISTLTGTPASDDFGAPEYWVRHARDAVRFADAVVAAAAQGVTRFVEVGPSANLATLIRECLAGRDPVLVAVTQRSGRAEPQTLVDALAELYIDGIAVGWTAHPATGGFVELPTYSFQRQRYWLRDAAAPALEGGDSGTAENAVDTWRYRESWRPVATPTLKPQGTWLVVTVAGTRDDLICAVLGNSAEVIRLVMSDIDDEPVSRLRALPPLKGVLFVPSVDDEDPGLGCRAVAPGTAETLVLIQALGEAEIHAPLWVVTRGAVSVAPAEAPDPGQAQIWGMGRVAALEHPRRWGGLVDLPAIDDERAVRRLVALVAGAGVEDQLAIRSTGVLARRLVRTATRSRQPWRPTGTVLITGGTGGIGAHLARWVGAHGATHVVLVGRRGAAAPGADRLVAEFARSGVPVSFAACDVTDRACVSALIDGLPGPLTAVLHAAGAVELGPLSALSLAEFDKVIRAKVRGAALLDELTRQHPIEAFVLFSSGAAAWGSGRQGAYAAGNAYLDALALRRRAAGLVATSVAWGHWAGEGMAADTETKALLERNGIRAMKPELAIEALADAIACGAGNSIVADIEWGRFAPPFLAARPSPLLAELPDVRRLLDATAHTQARRSPSLPAAGHDPELLGRLVLDEIAATLGYSASADIDEQRPFRDLGFDSLAAVEFRDRLSRVLGRDLPATLTFDHPTPQAVVSYLQGESNNIDDGAAPAAVVADDEIAIVSMACRYPGGLTSPEALWDLVAAGAEGHGGFPLDRGWDMAGIPDVGGGFLYDAADFDAELFGISPREALAMDPQQRL
ncbi:SDR family NAD(P)-dependent oxidoreductase, partial [Nocardia sp. NPDC055002]